MLSKTSVYVKRYDGQTKWMHFLIEDDVLLENYNTIWDKVSADIIENYSKTKVKSHGDEAADFQDKKIPKLDSNYTCWQ